MSKLIRADIFRNFRTRAFFIILLIEIGVVSILFMVNTEETIEAGADLFSSSFFGFGTTLLPMLVGTVVCFGISSEFASGAVRNKLAVGHKRTSVYASWLVCSFVLTLTLSAIYTAASFVAAPIFSVSFAAVNAKAIIINLTILIVQMLSFSSLVVLICIIAPGYKSIAIMFVYNETLMIVLTMAGEMNRNSEAIKLINRFFIQGQFSLNGIEATSKPWLSVLCTCSLAVIATIAGVVSFKKKDLK